MGREAPVLDREIDAWTADSPDRLSSMCRQFMEIYYHLRETAASEVFFKWYSKFHLMIHICESGVCPKSIRNYMGESEIGKAARLTETCNVSHLGSSLVETHRLTYVDDDP